MDKKMNDVITTHLMKELNPAFIIVFGSFAKGTQRNDSDLDLAFYPEDRTNPPTSYQLFMIAQELAEKIKREVDLVNLQTASTVFGAQIFHTGEVLYMNDQMVFEQQRMTTLSMYIKLNEERKEVLDRIYESGSIYEQ